MNAHNTVFNSYPRPTTLNLPVATAGASASPSWFMRARSVLSTWAAAASSSHEESRLWDIAMSDPRVMAKLIQGRQWDASESLVSSVQSAPVTVTVTAKTASVMPSKAPAVQGLSVLLERVYQSRHRMATAA